MIYKEIKMKHLLVLISLTLSLSIFAQGGGNAGGNAQSAGNGSSGGGHIHGDSLNPWFLQNSTTINYCLKVSPDFSSMTDAELKGMIEEAFAFWKQTFSQHSVEGNFNDFSFPVKLATQNFIYQHDCEENIDLIFQLGYLDEAQSKLVDRPRTLVGINVRTAYDKVNLKGKGFIYLAPERGPLRPLSERLHSHFWSAGNHLPLRIVLRHEIGHLFGLKDDYYFDSGLMSAIFPESVTSKESVEYLAKQQVAQANIFYPLGCNVSLDGTKNAGYGEGEIPGHKTQDPLLEYLGMKGDRSVDIISKNGVTIISLNDKDFGTIRLPERGVNHNGETQNLINLYLTKVQSVFSGLPAEAFQTPISAIIYDRTVKVKDLTLSLKSGKSLPVFMTFNKECEPEIGTIYNGKVYFDIFSPE